jgi:hypothetical protein
MKYFAIAVTFGIAGSSLAMNLVSNSGFESGVLSPWVQDSNFAPADEDWNVTNADSFTGSFSATDVGDKGLFQGFTVPNKFHITDVSFAIRNLDGSLNAYDLIYSDSTKGTFLYFPTDGNWHVVDVTANVDTTKVLSGIRIFGVSGGDTQRTFVDDVQVDAVPEPATMAALGVGAMAFLRRRRNG